MKLDDYQEKAMETRTYPVAMGLAYTGLALAGEAGEVANKIKKVYRDFGGKLSPELRQSIIDEAGDVLWYIAALSDELGIPLSDVAQRNLDKLASRKERDAIAGNGDDR